MQINWLPRLTHPSNTMSELLHLEYQLCSFLFVSIIQEVEHLAKYSHFIAVVFDTELKKFEVSHETPEPLFSFICSKVTRFNSMKEMDPLGYPISKVSQGVMTSYQEK
tara:strand:- start:25155 stop:25478 length:324 start_codon:yes stop_codon:yes gene_type:complete